jgi:hypothetical protein
MFNWLAGRRPLSMGIGFMLIAVSISILLGINSYATNMTSKINIVLLGIQEGFGWMLACAIGTVGVAVFRWSVRKEELNL